MRIGCGSKRRRRQSENVVEASVDGRLLLERHQNNSELEVIFRESYFVVNND
jgi:hypothetical protein